MRIYDCGFEQQTILEYNGYQAASTTPTISYPTPGLKGITGTRYLKMQTNGFGSGSQLNFHRFTASAEIYLRFRAYFVYGGGVELPFGFGLHDASGNNVFSFLGNQSDPYAAVVGNATSIGDSGSYVVASGTTPILFEAHVKIDASAGEIEVKADGVTIFTFSGNTDPDSRVTCQRLYVRGGGWDDDYYGTDDVSVNDATGSDDNSWVGSGYLLYLAPNGNGDSSDLVGSDGNSTDNYLLVDETPHDGDATFVAAAASGDKDNYALAALPTLPAGATIRFVHPVAIAKRFTTPSDIDVGIKSDATEDFAASQALTTSYAMYRGERYYVDPDDSAAWDETKVNALTASVRAG